MNDQGEIDMLDLTPLARRDSAGQRERAEREGLAKVDGRFRRRKNRTEPMSFRFSPQTAQPIRRLADAGNASYVEIVEQALVLLDKVKKGEKL
ncbi:MAG: hypothetical protein ACLPWS_21245 [Rhodomicrobium sp.]